MSFGIVRVQKFKSSGVRGIQSHDHREKESRSNPDIDKERSGQNFALVECQNFNQAIKQNLDSLETTKAIRKDAVVMCQLLVTSDHDFFSNKIPEPDKQRKFFEQSLAFIADRYGQKNIISATVHMDEKTPHMHVNLTPIRDGRLSANNIFTRSELSSLHSAFHASVGQAWGLERGQNREEKRQHLNTETYKHQTKMAAMKAELEQTRDELAKAKTELASYKGLHEGTARALAEAQTWSVEKARQAVEEKRRLQQQEQERKDAPEKENSSKRRQRGHGMGR